MIGQTSRGQAGVPQTVAGLSTPEQFVLGVCRCWDAFVDGPDPTLAWRELTPVFAYMNVLGAFCAFERIFAVLRAQPMLALEFHEVDAAQLSADEARLIYGLACLQRGRPEAAISVLRQSLTRYAVRLLLPPLARIAAILDRQGHRLPLWSPAAAEGSQAVARTLASG